MNQRSTDSTISSSNRISADAISRRAYEIWEREGRPEGCDLRHWLQAEQELGVSHADNGKRPESAPRAEPGAGRTHITDTRPMQGTRGTPPVSRDTKRPPIAAPMSPEKNGVTSAGSQQAAKRKPAAAPMM